MKIEQMSYRKEIVEDMPFEIGIVLCNRFGQKAYKKLLDRLEQRCNILDNLEKIANTTNSVGLKCIKDNFLYTKRSRLKDFTVRPVFSSFTWGFTKYEDGEIEFNSCDLDYWYKLVKIVQKDCEKLRKTYEYLHKPRRVYNNKRELTIRELFMFNAPQKLIQFLIDEKVLDKFIKNLESDSDLNRRTEKEIESSMKRARISSVFYWSRTEEGVAFWGVLDNKYEQCK